MAIGTTYETVHDYNAKYTVHDSGYSLTALNRPRAGRRGRLVSLGDVPTHGETSYGYHLGDAGETGTCRVADGLGYPFANKTMELWPKTGLRVPLRGFGDNVKRVEFVRR